MEDFRKLLQKVQVEDIDKEAETQMMAFENRIIQC